MNNDRTVRLDGRIFEAPTGLIGMQVTLRFEDYDSIEVYVDDKSRGFLKPLNQEVNSRIGREPVSSTTRSGGTMFESMQAGV